jgi:hypothetical protein
MTMIATLALALVGSWTYGGFLAQPTPPPAQAQASAQVQAPTPPPASAPIASPGITPGSPAMKTKPAETPREPGMTPGESPTTWIPPQAPATLPPAAPPRIASKPTLYRSTDASGQTWEHPDSAYLSSFVEARNRSFASYSQDSPVTYTYASPLSFRASRCSNGRCN